MGILTCCQETESQVNEEWEDKIKELIDNLNIDKSDAEKECFDDYASGFADGLCSAIEELEKLIGDSK